MTETKEEYPNFLKITYRSVGFDHDGYCSGEEAELTDSDNEPEVKEFIRIEKNQYNIPLKFFSDDGTLKKCDFFKKYAYFNDKCVSGLGRGVCKGFYQKVRAIKIQIEKGDSVEFKLMDAKFEYEKNFEKIKNEHNEKLTKIKNQLELEYKEQIKKIKKDYEVEVNRIKNEGECLLEEKRKTCKFGDKCQFTHKF